MLLWSVYFAKDRCERMSMVHWEIVTVTYLRDTSLLSRWRMVQFLRILTYVKNSVNIYIRRRFTHILNDLSKVTTVVTRSFLAALFSHVKYFYVFVAK